MKCGASPLVLLLATSGIVLAQQSTPPPARFPTAKITTEQLLTYKSEIEAMPGIQCRDILAHQRQCSSNGQFTVWTFTLAGHPAHPAVSRGVMLVRQTSSGSTIGIDRSGHYAGDSAAFETWMNDFQLVDQEIAAIWQAKHQPK
jgi:hypothetical protein